METSCKTFTKTGPVTSVVNMRTTCYSQHCHGHCRKNVYTITDIKKTTYQARKARNSKKGNKDLSAIPTFRTESETRASDRSPEFCNTTQELVLTVSRPNSQNYGQTRRSGNDVRLPKEFLWGILGTVKCHRVVRGESVPAHITKAYGGSRGTAPIISTSATSRSEVNSTPLSLYNQRKKLVPTEQVAGGLQSRSGRFV